MPATFLTNEMDQAEYQALLAERGIVPIPKAHLTPDGA